MQVGRSSHGLLRSGFLCCSTVFPNWGAIGDGILGPQARIRCFDPKQFFGILSPGVGGYRSRTAAVYVRNSFDDLSLVSRELVSASAGQ